MDSYITNNNVCEGKAEKIYMIDSNHYRCVGLDETSFRNVKLRLGDIEKYHYGVPNCNTYEVSGEKDGVTNQIVNTKRIDIEFFLNSSDEYSNGWLEEVKYIDAVILPYLTQMIPSNVILTVKYKSKAYKVCDECDNKNIACLQ